MQTNITDPKSTASTQWETHVLRIEGMHCAGCSAAITQELQAQPGVRNAIVDHLSGMATVETEAFVTDQKLVDVVVGSGYQAQRMEAIVDPVLMQAEAERAQSRSEFLWRRRSQIGFALWIPMESLHWITMAQHMHNSAVDIALLIGSTLSMVLVGSGFWRSAWSVLRVWRTNMDVLIALGATTAYVASLVIFIAQHMGQLQGQSTWFSEAAALLAIISLGHWFEAKATKSAGAAVRELLELQPEKAERIGAAGESEFIQSQDIRAADLIMVRPGGRVPIDGMIEVGEADLDESVMTGEPLPVRRTLGERVSAGTMCFSGMLHVRAATTGRDTSLSRIARLVQHAQTSRPPIQRMADRVAAVFVPLVLVIAAATAIGWGAAGSWPTGIMAATAVLIISCPCALGLAGPMAVMVGTGEASLRGILIKDAAALERAGRIATILFDKTGTLTKGEPVVTNIELLAFDAQSDSSGKNPNSQSSDLQTDAQKKNATSQSSDFQNDAQIKNAMSQQINAQATGQANSTSQHALSLQHVLALSAAVESGSEHPIARAITRRAAQENVVVPLATQFESTPGLGVRAQVNGQSVEMRRDASASCVLLINGASVARFTLADSLRAEAPKVIKALHTIGMKTGLITGDRLVEALRIARESGIDQDMVTADATPESKLAVIRGHGESAMMVGDGVNDSAALAAAGLGVAMGGGTSIASESASIVLVGGTLSSLPALIDISKATLRCMRQNLFLAFMYNVVAIPLAAFALLGAYGPAIAAAAMACSDISVVGNAVRLKWALKRARNRSV
ncbi:MAG: cation-translocating P-type ATPase [Phycisphaerales bacterium]